MDVDCNLALIDILWVVIDHDALGDAELPAEHVGPQDLLLRVLSWHPYDVEQFVLDDAERHQLPDPLLLASD